MKKTIFVTGGAGYIGSHTCKKLYEEGFTPITIDDLSTGYKKNVLWGPLEKVNINNTSKLIKLFKEYSPQAVIHFAGSAYIEESFLNPLKYFHNNISGTISLLKAMEKVNLDKIIFSSSCATYGIPAKNPIPENALQKPINPYGLSKLYIENIIKNQTKYKKLSYIILRYFNASGCSNSNEIGEDHEPETHLIPRAIISSIKNEIFYVNGNNYKTIDGTAIRDFIHVEDLAEAHIISLNYLLDGGNSDIFNIGSGKGYSILQIINELRKLKIIVNYEFKSSRKGDPPILIANTNKFIKKFLWKPKHSLNNILETAIKWQLKK